MKTADEMFRDAGYNSVMSCNTRRTYQKVVGHQQFDIIVDAKRIWKRRVNITCPSDNSNATWWEPAELLAAAQSIEEMGCADA